MTGPYMGSTGDQFAGADPRELDLVGARLRTALERAKRAEARVDELERALREARDGLAALAFWRDHSEAGCNACDARAYNYDPVRHNPQCAYLTIRAALHPDQRETT